MKKFGKWTAIAALSFLSGLTGHSGYALATPSMEKPSPASDIAAQFTIYLGGFLFATGNFEAPYQWGRVDGEECLLVRTSDVMHHLSRTPALRDTWNSLPVKSDRIFKKQLKESGVVLSDSIERTIGNKVGTRRVSHMTAISLAKLEEFGLHAAPAEIMPNEPSEDYA